MRCFSFQELFLVFAAATSIAYVSVGSHVVQLSTLAIGGIMSMIASAMVLCLDEHRWLQNPEAWLSCGYLGSVPWERQTASLRYVDDLLQVSAVYCAQCLALLPDAVYKVPFQARRIWGSCHMDRFANRFGACAYRNGAETCSYPTVVGS